MAALPPTVLEEGGATGHVIELLHVIGSGSFGTVFKAIRRSATRQSEQEQQVVAVKEIRCDDDSEEPREAVQEAALLCRSRSPFVVSYIASFFGSSTPLAMPTVAPSSSNRSAPSSSYSFFIVEDFVEGATLASFLSVQRASAATRNKWKDLAGGGGGAPATSSSTAPACMEEEEVACVVVDLVSGLKYLHECCGILHRDVKSSNVLLCSDDGICKLCDLGTGGRLDSAADKRTTMIGTPGWMAPEVWGNGGHHEDVSAHVNGSITGRKGSVLPAISSLDNRVAQNFAADIWSVGVTVLEMVLTVTPESDPLFSQYIRFLGSLPCSFVATASTSTATNKDVDGSCSFRDMSDVGTNANERRKFPQFSALRHLLQSPRLLDFVACCLRRDPAQRPSARDLLQHPFLVADGGTSTTGPRKRSIVKRMVSVARAASVMPDTHKQQDVSATVEGRLVGEAQHPAAPVPSIHHALLLSPSSSADGTSTVHLPAPHIVIPEAFWRLTSSDTFRGFQKPSSSASAPTLPAGSSDLDRIVAAQLPTSKFFNDMVAPSLFDSRTFVLRALSVSRAMSGGNTAPGFLLPTTNAALLDNYEAYEGAMDRLLKALHQAESIQEAIEGLRARSTSGRPGSISAEPFSLQFCRALSSELSSGGAPCVASVASRVSRFEELRHNPFRSQFRPPPSTLRFRPEAASEVAPTSESAMKTPATNPKLGRSSHVNGESAPFTVRDLLDAPSIPYCPQTKGATGAIPQPPSGAGDAVMDPTAMLYNRWLQGTRSKYFGGGSYMPTSSTSL